MLRNCRARHREFGRDFTSGTFPVRVKLQSEAAIWEGVAHWTTASDHPVRRGTGMLLASGFLTEIVKQSLYLICISACSNNADKSTQFSFDHATH